jgi:nitrogen fixation protein NifQ
MSSENISTLLSSPAPALISADLESWYARLMAEGEVETNSVGKANQVFMAKMIASWVSGQGALPMRLGLSVQDYACLLQAYYPQMTNELIKAGSQEEYDPERLPEREDVLNLLLEYRAGKDASESWIAEIVVAACMGLDHLWQDLGLWSRNELSEMLMVNFPGLARLNDRNMKWKKFLYKQLCERDGTFVCRAPSCDVCADYQKCFGPED